MGKGQRVRADEDWVQHWNVDLCTTCCTEPKNWCLACFCAPCFACHQRCDILDGNLDPYKCCGGAYGDCDCFGEDCPKTCLCLEATFCFWCSVFGNRWLIQSRYGIQNTMFEECVIWLACIISWIRCIYQFFFNIPFEIEILCDIIYCMFSACMQSQQQAEIRHQKKHGGSGGMNEHV